MALHVKVCKVADVLADELNAFSVEGVTWPVIVTIVDGAFIACTGVCPHEDVPLAGGYLHGAKVMCPAHAYMFDLRTGRCSHDASLELRRYPVKVVGDEIWVDLL